MAFIIPFATIAHSNPQIGKWRCSSTAVDFPQERDQNPNKQKESERFWGAAGARPFARWGWCPLSRALFMRAAPAHPAALTATGAYRCGAGKLAFFKCEFPFNPRIYMPPTRKSGHGRYSSERGPLDFPAPMNSRQDIFVRCRGLLAPVRCALWIAKFAPLNPTWPQFSATRPPIRYAPATGRARRETPSLRSGDSRLALIPPLNASRRSVSPLRLPPLYGESGVRPLRARAFSCGVGGCSPPSAWRGGCGSRSPSHRPSP